ETEITELSSCRSPKNCFSFIPNRRRKSGTTFMRVPLIFESSIRREARLQYRASSFEKPCECHRGFHGEIPVLEYLGGPGQLSPRAGRVSSLLHGHTGDGVAPIRVACPAQGAN